MDRDLVCLPPHFSQLLMTPLPSALNHSLHRPLLLHPPSRCPTPCPSIPSPSPAEPSARDTAGHRVRQVRDHDAARDERRGGRVVAVRGSRFVRQLAAAGTRGGAAALGRKGALLLGGRCCHWHCHWHGCGHGQYRPGHRVPAVLVVCRRRRRHWYRYRRRLVTRPFCRSRRVHVHTARLVGARRPALAGRHAGGCVHARSQALVNGQVYAVWVGVGEGNRFRRPSRAQNCFKSSFFSVTAHGNNSGSSIRRYVHHVSPRKNTWKNTVLTLLSNFLFSLPPVCPRLAHFCASGHSVRPRRRACVRQWSWRTMWPTPTWARHSSMRTDGMCIESEREMAERCLFRVFFLSSAV